MSSGGFSWSANHRSWSSERRSIPQGNRDQSVRWQRRAGGSGWGAQDSIPEDRRQAHPSPAEPSPWDVMMEDQNQGDAAASASSAYPAQTDPHATPIGQPREFQPPDPAVDVPPSDAEASAAQQDAINAENSWIERILQTLEYITTLGAIPNTNNLALFLEPEKVDHTLFTAFGFLLRVRNQWTELGDFHCHTPYLDAIFPPEIIGTNSKKNLAESFKDLDMTKVVDFMTALQTRYCPSKEQNTRAEKSQGRFFHDSTGKVWPDNFQCPNSWKPWEKNQAVLGEEFAKMYPNMWYNASKRGEWKYSQGIFDYQHGEGYQ